MTATNRSAVRAELASVLETDLTGAGNPAQAVYSYKVGDFGGLSPVLVVTSAGSEREYPAYGTAAYYNNFYFSLQVYVLYAETGTTYGEDDAETQLDLVEKSIADTFSTYESHSGYWHRISYDGPSQVVEGTTEGGVEYLIELIRVKVEVDDS